MRKFLPVILLAGSLLGPASIRASILYQETFSTDGTLDDYTGAGKIFTSYSGSGVYTAAASGGKFNLGFTGGQDGSLYTYTSFGSARQLLSMQVDFTLNSASAADKPLLLFISDFANIGDFGPDWNMWNAQGNWSFANPGALTSSYPVTATDGLGGTHTDPGLQASTTYTWSFFLNQSGIQETYQAPDGVSRTLNTDTWSMYIGDTLVADNVPRGAQAENIQGLVLQLSRNYNGGSSSMNLDNIVIRDDLALVPEPATAALLTLGALFLLPRRRHLVA